MIVRVPAQDHSQHLPLGDGCEDYPMDGSLLSATIRGEEFLCIVSGYTWSELYRRTDRILVLCATDAYVNYAMLKGQTLIEMAHDCLAYLRSVIPVD